MKEPQNSPLTFTDMAVIKSLNNKLVLGIYLADIYLETLIGRLTGKFNLKPYDNESIPDYYNIFNQLGGFDIFTMFVNPRHMFITHSKIYNHQRIKFVCSDCNGNIKLFAMEIDFDKEACVGNHVHIFSLVVRFIKVKMWTLDPTESCSYISVGFVKYDSINKEMIEKFEKFTKFPLSF